MHIYYFPPGETARTALTTDRDSRTGFFWFDIERDESNWYETVREWLAEEFYGQHISDSLNDTHVPFFDGSDRYDMLIIRSLVPKNQQAMLATYPIAFFITHDAVITIRGKEDPIFDPIRQGLQKSKTKPVESVSLFTWSLLDHIANGLLGQRASISERLAIWQEKLLQGSADLSMWQEMMAMRNQLRRLEMITESQLDAIGHWRELGSLRIPEALQVYYNDLQEHMKRIYRHALITQHDIDALVNIYFSANTQRTNNTLKFLAIISAVFLPLNLIAGIFGMNFSYLPLLSSPYGPVLVTVVMLIISVTMLRFFRKF
jgi:magnesium/cobalt transport protein CorA